MRADETYPAGSGSERSGGASAVVSLGSLRVSYSPRLVTIDPEHVAALAEVVDLVPALLVDPKTMHVIDGIHRFEAFRQAGRAEVQVRFVECDEFESIALAIQTNTRHGKPLSRTERIAAARLLLSKKPERSDRWLGEVCGLSHTTIAKLRTTADGTVSPVRLGRDGRRRPTSSEDGRRLVRQVLTEEPVTTFRDTAKAAGIAPSTAHRVAKGLHADGAPAQPTTTGLAQDPAFRSNGEFGRIADWLERTALDATEVEAYLALVPLGRVYEVADECRTRSRAWAALAANFEKRARAQRRWGSETETSGSPR